MAHPSQIKYSLNTIYDYYKTERIARSRAKRERDAKEAKCQNGVEKKSLGDRDKKM